VQKFARMEVLPYICINSNNELYNLKNYQLWKIKLQIGINIITFVKLWI
jgi:hypothetical protein